MDREDLGALFARATRRLVDAERPLLAARGLSMWDYVVLSHLAREPAGTQLALARAIGYDKTRLIGLLDALEREGFVTRTPDPADRRARIVSLTPAGATLHAAAQADVHAMEDELLAHLSPTARRRLVATLTELTSGTPDD
ncbi:MarR family winged helix-turn-helix transcriptional regulator [Conexibacter woesei]|uniref:Transcriptional regulator, MarR family n=1 Tax=Conexibacter woesei (strain DSM 14684 / CCUG 47730 / CIP 108061 / JCM 11494 / NBRC 100937 / ID131577) TaxID=469383 RepID=D3F6E6_CONWI|nr:MarR family transcriptional regulator [Conexibacter woesei]ADB50713.1 transcriptional regulator, MarR family [Conexibacter woesei DSM 14684]